MFPLTETKLKPSVCFVPSFASFSLMFASMMNSLKRKECEEKWEYQESRDYASSTTGFHVQHSRQYSDFTPISEYTAGADIFFSRLETRGLINELVLHELVGSNP